MEIFIVAVWVLCVWSSAKIAAPGYKTFAGALGFLFGPLGVLIVYVALRPAVPGYAPPAGAHGPYCPHCGARTGG